MPLNLQEPEEIKVGKEKLNKAEKKKKIKKQINDNPEVESKKFTKKKDRKEKKEN